MTRKLHLQPDGDAKRLFFDRFGVNDPDVDRYERADRRKVATAAWKLAISAVKRSRTSNDLPRTHRLISTDAAPIDHTSSLDVERAPEDPGEPS